MKRVMFFLGICVVVLIEVRWTIFARSVDKNFLFTLDPVFSVDCCLAIKDEFLHDVEKNISAMESILHIKEMFPFVDTVSIAHRPHADVITIKGYELLSVINDELVLTANKQFYKKSFFSPSAFDERTSIIVSQECLSLGSGWLYALLYNFPDDFFHYYDCHCIDRHCIKLVDKSNNNFCIVYSGDHIVSPYILDQCKTVKNAIVAQAEYDKSVKWVTDIRFADYIVAYKV